MKPRRDKPMDEGAAYPPAGRLEPVAGPGTAVRIGEERAARILERAAALDAKRSSEIELDQLREAAAAAGISREAFDEAMEEQDDQDDPPEAAARSAPPKLNWRGQGVPSVNPVHFAHYTALLRDVLGDDGQVMVVEDRIEWSNDEGLVVSVSPSAKSSTAAVSLEGRLSARLWTITLSILPVMIFFFMFAMEEEEALIGLLGALLALGTAGIGVSIHYRRERKELRKKAERIRRQLQHLLPPGPGTR
jgi:hypothetical protein